MLPKSPVSQLLLALALGATLLISGCGQKGDLYLPDSDKPAPSQNN